MREPIPPVGHSLHIRKFGETIQSSDGMNFKSDIEKIDMSKSRIILKAIANCALRMTLPGMFGAILDAAESIRKELEAGSKEAQRKADFQAMLAASTEEMKKFVRDCLDSLDLERGTEIRKDIKSYLFSVQAQSRRCMRRPDDPSGTTMAPEMSLKTREDYARILPPKMPRFQVGHRPIPGVDKVLVELLGFGGYGEVWKTESTDNGRKIYTALKICNDSKAAKSIKRESVLITKIMEQTSSHPGFVKLLNSYLENDPPCLEYEFIEGGDLASVFNAWKKGGIKQTPERAVKILKTLAKIVSLIHELKPPIIHRDLKPANILLVMKPDRSINFKIADLGIGGIVAQEAVEQYRHGQSLGKSSTLAHQGSYTPLYASPEQMDGASPDSRDDVHALGVIWYQMLMGNSSLGAPSGSGWQKELEKTGMPRYHINILMSCMESSAGDRPKDASAICKLLKPVAKQILWLNEFFPPDLPKPLPRRAVHPQRIESSRKNKVFLIGEDATSNTLVRYLVKVLRSKGQSAKVYDLKDRRIVRTISSRQNAESWNDFFELAGHQIPYEAINEKEIDSWVDYGIAQQQFMHSQGLQLWR